MHSKDIQLRLQCARVWGRNFKVGADQLSASAMWMHRMRSLCALSGISGASDQHNSTQKTSHVSTSLPCYAFGKQARSRGTNRSSILTKRAWQPIFFMYNFFVLFCKNLPLLWSDPVGTRRLRGQSPYACCVPLSQCLSSSNVSELDPGVHELGNCLARFLHACRSWVSFAFNTPLAHSCVLAGFASWKLQWCQIVERSKLHFSNVHCTSFHQNSQCIHL